MRRHEGLRDGRRLAVSPATATVFPSPVAGPPGADGFYGDMASVAGFVRRLPSIAEHVERSLQAALQRVSTIKPAKKRAAVEQAASRGAKLKEIERGIVNLDRWQKTAAIESPDGPQRIRGLAGSGNAIVLALKADSPVEPRPPGPGRAAARPPGPNSACRYVAPAPLPAEVRSMETTPLAPPIKCRPCR